MHKSMNKLATNTTLTCLDGVSWGEREASLTGRPPEDRDYNETKELGTAWFRIIFPGTFANTRDEF